MPDQPHGIVTILFTDIEGSVRRWERDPEAMRGAIARHNILLHGAIAQHGGYVFQVIGDAFCAAFADASNATGAALAAQRALIAEPWGAIGPVRVRMALHTGPLEESPDGYSSGPTLIRVARLLATGHGGQTLLSHATADLVRDHLPPGVRLRDLGERRLKDLRVPEHIFQLVAADLPTSFPPLRTVDTRPTNLPAPPGPLIGRAEEVAAAQAHLQNPGVRLLTLTGPGGAGKTRLGLHVSQELLDEFEHGVFFVSLAPIRDPDLVVSAIAGALGVPETGRQPPIETLKSYLRDRQILLLLDNFEQVTAAGPIVADLLMAGPRLKVLVTSRAVLHLRSEHQFPVFPLAVPPSQNLPSPALLAGYPAVALFTTLARAIDPLFALTEANSGDIAAICRHLDGLPLAIELAAACCDRMTPALIHIQLANRFALLVDGAHDLPPRQQTLRAVLDWSYDLLDPAEQCLFRRLAVFVGGCSLEGAEQVITERIGPADPAPAPSCPAGMPPPPSAVPPGHTAPSLLAALTALVDKSLLRQETTPDGLPHFTMLETIREYALERLEASGEAEPLRHRRAQYYIGLAETAEPALRGEAQSVWMARLEQEHDNLRAVLGWALEHHEVEIAARLAGAVWRFWYRRGYLREGRRHLEVALAHGPALPPALQATLARGAGVLAWAQSDYPTARSYFEASLTLGRRLDDRWMVAMSLNNLGHIALEQADFPQAATYLEESLALQEALGDDWGCGYSLANLGNLALLQHDFPLAIARFQASLVVRRRVGDSQGIADALCALGTTVLYQGDRARAKAAFTESLTLAWEAGSTITTVDALEGLAAILGAEGQATRAACLFGAGAALREAIGTPIWFGDRANYEREVAAVRAQLEPPAFAAAWAAGQALLPEQAVAYALDEAGGIPS